MRQRRGDQRIPCLPVGTLTDLLFVFVVVQGIVSVVEGGDQVQVRFVWT